ncbi:MULTISPECIES: GntR family transcriptional regulator [Leisingera]|jgi:DNA-binding GntR family transcriptional regulator|uniref:GntR family transcriptional regulator n=1 Tax=Leisingera aquaemixtae TaxID=1396826 RepID=A0ABY5WHJ0_9RHOB|nr:MULTISPECIES: GntR family transcriptional regulator [Leisingera]QDI74571.1 GntR family transcriptional regulator [Leisingera aquaemixtae]UWQ24302.1 GntR family transcriptional regulator [Leisingera aquaemixtae]UWQ40938.1 GntR family transcriptional regulator [Leisingera aquaemixtae]UWQ45208.1 GntR family transcriptional regulator [Leisingera aquaemixtae]
MKDSPENQIVNAILDAISEQRLPAGTKLGEQALSDLFSCNRANVRRALASLAAQQVVELRPNRGAFVMTPSPKEARDIFQARRAIERTIARHASGQASAEDIAFLRGNIQEEAKARKAGDKPAELRASRQFHMRIAHIAGNLVLERFLSELTMRSTLILGLYSPTGSSSCAEDEHDRIVDALEAGKTDELVRLADEHLRHLEEGLNFDEPPAAPMSLREQLAAPRKPPAAE